MSMTSNTAIQLLGMFAAYLVITVLGPHFVVGKTLRYKNKFERFMLYSMLGNFYVMNLVYLLELLHISYPITLILFTVVPCVAIKIKLEGIPFVSMLGDRWETLRRFAGGQLKWKNYRAANVAAISDKRKKFFDRVKKNFLTNIPDFILIVALLAALFWEYGVNLFVNYGYKYSDLVVHTYWINELNENNIFCSGVYPFGFHNMLYYMHSVFGFDTYVLLRLMSLVIVTWNTLIILCFLRLLCKSRYVAYIGAFAYAIIDIFEYGAYARYGSPLPQEYGIMFILPSIYCGFAYFKEQRKEIRGDASKKSYMYLTGFAISFAMTLSVHFYGTMIAGLYAVAMAIGFGGWLFRKPYFKKVMLTCVASVLIAILPMGVAFATGTELQGSLMWGLGVIFGNTSDGSSTSDDDSNVGGGTPSETTETTESTNYDVYIQQYGPAVGRLVGTVAALESDADYCTVKTNKSYTMNLLFATFPLMMILGAAFMIGRRDRMYGATLLATGLFMVFMAIMVGAHEMGLPRLMDLNRASVYFAYSICATLPLLLDGMLYLVLGRIKSKWVINSLSMAAVLACAYLVFSTGCIREPLTMLGMESNEAIKCITKIISEEKDYTWTICSANDEGRMVYDHGFHYELIDFLRGMEYIGSVGRVRIPTEIAFFFVEKTPVDYYETYDTEEETITSIDAERNLPLGTGLQLYQGENRWTCMARLYYWSQKFMELYPNEMTVFYETDEFVCYRVEQNTYRLFNFAIDYGYNNVATE